MTSSAVPAYRPYDSDVAPDPVIPAAPTAVATFTSDRSAEDHLGRDRLALRLLRVLADRRTETPLTLAVFGTSGSGKTGLLARAGALAAESSAVLTGPEARAAAGAGIVPVRIDLAGGGDPAPTIARALVDALAQDHASLVEEALHAGGNPQEAAKRAGERSIALRRALDGERKILDDFGARRARLAETVLFETAGTRVDGYARANRTRIEGRLRAFGLPAIDPLRTYKDFVRETWETPGPGSRIGLLLRSLWGFKGQGSLIVLAILLFAVSWGAAAGAGDEARLSGWLAALGDHFSFLTDWERAHLDLLQPISQAAAALGALALAALVVRAVRFAAPVLKGATLLKADLGERRRDIDGLIAQQTRRIDGLAAEAEAAARTAEQAERRLGGRREGGLTDHGAALAGDLFGAARDPSIAAEAFCAALSRSMAEQSGAASGDAPLPGRIVALVDGLDRLVGREATATFDTVHRLLAKPGFAVLVALDRRRILEALGDADPALAASELERLVQLSYDLGAAAPDAARFADLLLDPRTAGPKVTVADGAGTRHDRDLQPFEAELIRGLAPFTAGTPRAVKRFVNAYRFARTDPQAADASAAVLGCLAWALAVDGTPAAADLGRFEADAAKGHVTLDRQSELGRAFSAVPGAIGGEFTASDARKGVAIARGYSRAG